MAPARGGQRAMCEDGAVLGGVGQGDAFACTRQNDFMFAHHRAAAQGGKADAAFLARAQIVAVARFDPVLVQRNIAGSCGGLAQQEGRA